MSKVVVESRVACASAVASLWDVLSDTDRMNRALKIEPVKFTALNDGSAARYLGKTRLSGFEVEYEERPFEWERHRRFGVLRRMRKGVLRSVEFSHAFETRPDGGTDILIRLSIEPVTPLLNPAVWLQARGTVRRMADEVRRVDGLLKEGKSATASPESLNTSLMGRAEQGLRAEASRELVDKLIGHLQQAGDHELLRLRPFALADVWGADRIAVLEVMLLAVKHGLLELHWELVCPSCQTATESVLSLSALEEHGACQLCEIDFGLDLDEAIEATFAPTPELRKVVEGPFCIGGPARVPHVFSQMIIAPGGTATLPSPSEAGRYRVFLRGGTTYKLEVADGSPTSVDLPAEQEGEGPVWKVAPSGTILVHNPSVQERHAKVERRAWSSQAATARDLTALPAFRRQFSKDLLRANSTLKVSRVALLFSDLTDSTQLYTDVGDAPAFKLVQDHFDVVFAEIAKHQGSVVKTIGDAVMAAFRSDEDALAAAIDVLKAFETFRAAHPNRQRTHIKLGIHGGPAYVVTANNVLDYFGQTVNVAARLQGLAHSGELVAPAELVEHALKQGTLTPGQVTERFDAKLKGVTGTMSVARLVKS